MPAALAITGGVLGAAGKYQEGQAAADLAKRNERLARIRGEDVLDIAELDIRHHQQMVARLIGSQRAGFAAQGVAIDVGTPVDLAADTMRTANIDEQRIYANALREKWGLQVQVEDFSLQAEQAHQAGTAGTISSLLGGGAQALGYFTQ